MIHLVLVFLTVQAFAAKPNIPRCYRPKDFSVGKFVESYEACLARQRAYCQSHIEIKNCGLQSTGKPYYKVAQDEIDPTKRCKILKDGTYACLQDPVRLILPDVAQTEQPAPSPSGSPSASPGGSPAAGIDTGAPRSITVPVDDSSPTTAPKANAPAPAPPRMPVPNGGN